VHPELAAAGLWTTPYDLALMVIGIVQSRAGRPDAFLAQALAIEMLKPGAGGAGLGTIIDDKGMFWHHGGNVGFHSLYVGDPVSGNGMAAMTNGDKGEEVWRLPPPHRHIEQRRLSPSAGRSQIDMATWAL
jgi:hypothetical protein